MSCSELTKAEAYPLYAQSTRQAKRLQREFQSFLKMMELDFIHFLPVPELNTVNIVFVYWDHDSTSVRDVVCTEEMKSKDSIGGNSITVCVTKRKNKAKARKFIRSYKTPCMLLVIGKTNIVKKRTRAGRFRCQSEIATFCQSVGRLLQRYVYSYLVAYTNVLSIIKEVQENVITDKKRFLQKSVYTKLREHGIQGPSTEKGTSQEIVAVANKCTLDKSKC